MDLKSHILSQHDINSKPYHVEEWGCEVFIRSLSGKQRNEIAALTKRVNDGKAPPDAIGKKILCLGLVDQDGNQLFSDADMEKLLDKNGKVLDELVLAISNHNAVDAEAVAAKKNN